MTGNSILILAAGMPRSGSTWLYNAARLLILSSPSMAQQFSCGWIGDWKHIPKNKYMLIKVHDYDDNLAHEAACVLYSYRDVRDAIASCFRKFGQMPSLETADHFIDEHERWTKVANYSMRYELMLQHKEDVVSQLIRILKLDNVDRRQIVFDLEKLSYNQPGPKNEIYHLSNLYHRRHITDGRHGSWKGLLDNNLIKQIETNHRDWFEKYGYLIDQ